MNVAVDKGDAREIVSEEILAALAKPGTMKFATLSIGEHVGAVMVFGESQSEADSRAAVLEAAVRFFRESIADVAEDARRAARLGRRPWERRS